MQLNNGHSVFHGFEKRRAGVTICCVRALQSCNNYSKTIAHYRLAYLYNNNYSYITIL